jgi:hypothetical protein
MWEPPFFGSRTSLRLIAAYPLAPISCINLAIGMGLKERSVMPLASFKSAEVLKPINIETSSPDHDSSSFFCPIA